MNHINRRHFLQTAGIIGTASALALAPHFAGRRSRAYAQSLTGRVFQLEKGGVKVHSYVAPEASFAVTSHIVETANSLVVIDTQFLQTFANELKTYADGLGKPVERIILSHAHPDHFLGASVFADVPFVSTPTIADGVQAYIEAGNVEQLAGVFGENEMPSEPRIPEGALTVGDVTIDGISFTLETVMNAEAPEHVIVRLPDAGVIVLQDLVFNNYHFFPGQDRENWVAILKDLRNHFAGYETLLPGHGVPTTKGELDAAIQYLTFANETVASASSADEIIAALEAEYPGYEGAGILSFWPLFFQGS